MNILLTVRRIVLFVFVIVAVVGISGIAEVRAQQWSPNSNEWFHLNDPKVQEGEPAVFTVKVPEKLKFAVRWRYQTEDWTATAGSDYIAAQGILEFSVGDQEKRITVRTLADETTEIRPEIFQLELRDLEISNDGGGTWEPAGYIPRLPEYAASTGTIKDSGLLEIVNPPDDEPKEEPVTQQPPESQEEAEPEGGHAEPITDSTVRGSAGG